MGLDFSNIDKSLELAVIDQNLQFEYFILITLRTSSRYLNINFKIKV